MSQVNATIPTPHHESNVHIKDTLATLKSDYLNDQLIVLRRTIAAILAIITIVASVMNAIAHTGIDCK